MAHGRMHNVGNQRNRWKFAAAVVVGLFLFGSVAEDASAVSKRKPSTKKATQKKTTRARTTTEPATTEVSTTVEPSTTTTRFDPALEQFDSPPFTCDAQHDLDGDDSADCMNIDGLKFRYWTSRSRRVVAMDVSLEKGYPSQSKSFRLGFFDSPSLTIWIKGFDRGYNTPNRYYGWWTLPLSFRDGKFRGWGATGEPVPLFYYSARAGGGGVASPSYSCGSRPGVYFRHDVEEQRFGEKITSYSFEVGPDTPPTRPVALPATALEIRTDCYPLNKLRSSLPAPSVAWAPLLAPNAVSAPLLTCSVAVPDAPPKVLLLGGRVALVWEERDENKEKFRLTFQWSDERPFTAEFLGDGFAASWGPLGKELLVVNFGRAIDLFEVDLCNLRRIAGPGSARTMTAGDVVPYDYVYSRNWVCVPYTDYVFAAIGGGEGLWGIYRWRVRDGALVVDERTSPPVSSVVSDEQLKRTQCSNELAVKPK